MEKESFYPLTCLLPYNKCYYFKISPTNQVNLLNFELNEDDHFSILNNTCITCLMKDGEVKSLSLIEIGNMFGFSYSPYIQFLHESMLRNIPFWGLEENACSSQIKGQSEFKDLLNSGRISKDIIIKHIGLINDIDVGYGIFSSQNIPTSTFIGEYVGVISDTNIPNSYSLSYPSAHGGYEISANEVGNIIRFVNHSQTPNCQFQHIWHENMIHIICVSYFVLL